MELRFSNLRGVQWRIFLGILLSSPCSSIEDYRRGAADSRRRYASLRRKLLVDPHLPKDGNKPIDPAMDNPLSQNPDSIWGRFFRNAELERELDQDLSRLYPEHGSYFQSSACQAMLRRVLLVWCLRHPEYGYRQGMHELLAPLLYVLHEDIKRHSEVRKKHEDHFTDEFETSFPESDVISNYRFTKKADWNGTTDGIQGMASRASSLDDLDPETRDVILLSDAYGAEGELGVVMSDRFMEHDAYCMFDALMNGSHGVVAMADFFSPSSQVGSSAFLPPVIEASSALYHFLSIVDPSLHSHLIELGVEPHYFAMRWLRVLFGREFSLDDLLVIWDEVFSCPNDMSSLDNDMHQHFKILFSPRGTFIAAMAVSMILHLRPSLLATELATSCLQKLLNFPENVDVKKLIAKARSLQALAFDKHGPQSPSQNSEITKSPRLSHSLSMGASSLRGGPPESYWEEKWRVLHKEEESSKVKKSKPFPNGIVKRIRPEKLALFRTESDTSTSKDLTTKKESRPVKRNLLDDLSREAKTLEKFDTSERKETHAPSDISKQKAVVDTNNVVSQATVKAVTTDYLEDSHGESFSDKSVDCRAEATSSVGENSSCFSSSSSPVSITTDRENDLEANHVTVNLHGSEYEDDGDSLESKALPCNNPNPTPASSDSLDSKNKTGNHEDVPKEKKAVPGKFQWFWNLAKSSVEANTDKGVKQSPRKPEVSGDSNRDPLLSASDGSRSNGKAEVADKNVIATLKNMGSSMLENIQVIESVFQQELGQSTSLENLSSNLLGGKGQTTTMAALRELRKISSLLSEM